LALISAVTGVLSAKLRTGEKPSGPVYLSAAGVAIGSRVLPGSSYLWRPEWRAAVFEAARVHLAAKAAAAQLAALTSTGFRLDDVEEIVGLAGFASNGQAHLNLALDGPHLFVLGPTGSGKSRWLEMFLASILNTHPQTEFWYADYKGGATLGRFAAARGTRGFTTDLVPNDEFWRALHDFVAEREAAFASAGIARIEEAQLSRHLVVVDELIPALRTGPFASSVIETIATRGRSLGIHLIVASQGTSGMGRLLLSSLRARLVMRGADPVDLAQLGITKKLQSQAAVGQGSALLATPNQTLELSFPLGFSQVPLPTSLPAFRARRRRAG
jgi:S-DNA-T family DNA segregation ATPase FtsK/SpoIIIE